MTTSIAFGAPTPVAPMSAENDSRAERIACALEAFVRERFLVRADDARFTRTTSLWDEGYVDSTGVVEVIAFLEQTFSITLPDEALFSPEFRSIAGIASLVAQIG
jgi:acyl carrier protein